MPKFKFTKEYGFKASAKMIYPYLSTSNGLSEWFVDAVKVDPEQVYHFDWQGDVLKGVMKTHKLNQSVKFEFKPKPGDVELDKPNFVEFKLVPDELTGYTYLHITDFSEMDDEIELNEMWDFFINTLKKKVGG